MINDSEMGKAYSEKIGDLEEYLLECDDLNIDNTFYGSKYFFGALKGSCGLANPRARKNGLS